MTWDPVVLPVVTGYRVYYNMYATSDRDMDRWLTVDVGPYTVADVPGLEPIAVLLLSEEEPSNEVTETARARFFAEEAANERKPWWKVPRRKIPRPRQVPATIADADLP